MTEIYEISHAHKDWHCYVSREVASAFRPNKIYGIIHDPNLMDDMSTSAKDLLGPDYGLPADIRNTALVYTDVKNGKVLDPQNITTRYTTSQKLQASAMEPSWKTSALDLRMRYTTETDEELIIRKHLFDVTLDVRRLNGDNADDTRLVVASIARAMLKMPTPVETNTPEQIEAYTLKKTFSSWLGWPDRERPKGNSLDRRKQALFDQFTAQYAGVVELIGQEEDPAQILRTRLESLRAKEAGKRAPFLQRLVNHAAAISDAAYDPNFVVIGWPASGWGDPQEAVEHSSEDRRE